MLEYLSLRRFSVRLLVGLVVLILLTTLSAGIPAYWLTRSQLERQAWTQVENAQRATQSLLHAELRGLDGIAELFTERPTLQRLVREGAVSELAPYAEQFQRQSDLDILLFCDAGNRLLAGAQQSAACSELPADGFALLDGLPAMVARQDVVDNGTGIRLGTAVTGIWLDEEFLQQLAGATGVAQSILSPNGDRLASSLPSLADTATDTPVTPLGRTTVDLLGQPYYVAYAPLASGTGESLLSEVALPVGDLLATERQALLVLAGSTGLVALFGALVGIWYVRQMIAPLRKLTAVAEEISKGDLIAPIPLFSSPDEISTLATALHRSQASMLRALQERSYFLANISHEFRTPLSTLNASMELLLDSDEALTAAEMRELLRPTYLSVRALQTLIDNLLESSSIEAGRFTINRRPTDINQVMEQALHMIGPLLERRQQSVTVNVETSPEGGPIDADAGRLTQVLVNLLNNASKYSPPGSPIEVNIRRQDGSLRVAVSDRGPGIPAAEREELFGRFVRREATDGEQYGIGLGLYVVKRSVEAHGGRVGIDDRPGGGSVFWFELPLNQ